MKSTTSIYWTGPWAHEKKNPSDTRAASGPSRPWHPAGTQGRRLVLGPPKKKPFGAPSVVVVAARELQTLLSRCLRPPLPRLASQDRVDRLGALVARGVRKQ